MRLIGNLLEVIRIDALNETTRRLRRGYRVGRSLDAAEPDERCR